MTCASAGSPGLNVRAEKSASPLELTPDEQADHPWGRTAVRAPVDAGRSAQLAGARLWLDPDGRVHHRITPDEIGNDLAGWLGDLVAAGSLDPSAFEEITRRARETIWLTPEPRYSWGLGGCDLPAYAEYCSRVRVVRDLTGLETAAAELATELVGR